MTAFRAETIAGLSLALSQATKACSALLAAGKVAVIEVKPETRSRSIEQNRLQRLWMLEAQEQGDMTAEEYRGYCKLHIGVPMLRAESDEFAAKYDQYVRPLPYETKMALMMEPFDFPVTRLMNTDQKKRYLDKVYVYLTGLGFKLTEPKQRNRRTSK